MKRILVECGLWNREYYADCPTSNGRLGCQPGGGCCAVDILAAERDFKEQKWSLQEEVEARGHKVLFYPKFHCELDLIVLVPGKAVHKGTLRSHACRAT